MPVALAAPRPVLVPGAVLIPVAKVVKLGGGSNRCAILNVNESYCRITADRLLPLALYLYPSFPYRSALRRTCLSSYSLKRAHIRGCGGKHAFTQLARCPRDE